MQIGIDPDKDLSGVAVKHRVNGIEKIELYTLPFFGLLEFLQERKELIKLVVIEGGWLNTKANLHNATANARFASSIGRDVGVNHGTGLLIVQMCEYLKLPYRVQKPLRKRWASKDGKITHAELVKYFKVTAKRTNQEQRDAALLIL